MMKVLIVDYRRESLMEMLQIVSDYYEAVIMGTCLSSIEALDMVESLFPDVVFIEASMPGLMGTELTRILRKEYPNVRVILVSESSDYACEAFQVGADGFLMKPLHGNKVNELLERINRTI